jgi:hypothetical protein
VDGGTPRTVRLGDVNGDGDVDGQDSSDISMCVLQDVPLPHPEAADVDCDGQITGADVNCVWELSQGLIEAFRCDFKAGIGATGGGGAGGSAPCGLKRGDVNGDGEVAIFDGDIVSQYGLCNPVSPPFYWVVADANCDGKIDILDALAVGRSVTGAAQLVSCNAGSGGAGGAAGAPGFAGNAGDGNTAGSAGQRTCAAGTGGTGVAGAGGAAAASRLGDVNGDGVVDLLDADEIAKYSSFNCPPPGLPLEVADVNCDCVVNLWDARLIAKYVQKAVDHLGCEAP